ncbi:hypothetical protein ACI2OX_19205 [Bacillus sp. N9]
MKAEELFPEFKELNNRRILISHQASYVFSVKNSVMTSASIDQSYTETELLVGAT